MFLKLMALARDRTRVFNVQTRFLKKFERNLNRQPGVFKFIHCAIHFHPYQLLYRHSNGFLTLTSTIALMQTILFV